MADLYHRFMSKFCTVPFIILCLLMAFGYSTASALRKTNIEEVIINDYKKKVAMARSEIEKINRDMEWLVLKIKRMEEFQRKIPQEMIDSVKQKKRKIDALTKIKKRFERLLQTNRTLQNQKFQSTLELKLEKVGLKDWMAFSEYGKKISLTNRLPILFASGSADIANEYKRFLKKLATLVKDYDVCIIVNGYTDMNPIHTQQYPSNFELGSARAANVVHELKKHGVKPSLFQIGSTGEFRVNPQKISKWKVFERYVNILVIFQR